MYHLKYYFGWEMHVKLHALKYKFLYLGLSLEVRENAKKKKVIRNYTCINLSAKEALSYKRKNSDRNVRERNKIKVIKLGIRRNKHTQIPPTFHEIKINMKILKLFLLNVFLFLNLIKIY